MRWFLALLLLLPVSVVAQQTTRPPEDPAKTAREAESRKLAQDLANPDRAVQDAAMAKIKEMMLADPQPGQAPPALMIGLWHRALLKVQRFDDAEFVAHTRILSVPWNGVAVATMQRLRVDGL